MKEVDNIEEVLDKDMKLVYENCGLDVVINLLENLPSINIYVSRKSVTNAQTKYILSNLKDHDIKDLAVKVGCSEQQAYRVIRDNLRNPKKAINQKSLFES
jgi:Mor family transcriptional regulator